MPATPIEIIREAYARYERRDLAGSFALLSPDIVVTQTPDLPWGGEHRGHEGVKRFFALLAEYTAALPRPITYISAGEDVAVFGRLVGTARATGQPIDIDIIHVWTVRDELVIRFQAFIDTPAMNRALGRG